MLKRMRDHNRLEMTILAQLERERNHHHRQREEELERVSQQRENELERMRDHHRQREEELEIVKDGAMKDHNLELESRIAQLEMHLELVEASEKK
jgi:hypothetical protein